MSKRIQRQRTKGWRMPEGAVYVGRPSRWGNPFRVGRPDPEPTWDPTGEPMGLERTLEGFRAYLGRQLRIEPRFLEPLKGHDLACWCALDQPCHADVLLEVAGS